MDCVCRSIPRTYNNQTRSSDHTFHVCLVFFSYWVNLLSGTSRKLAERARGEGAAGGESGLRQYLGGVPGVQDNDSHFMWSQPLQPPDFWFFGGLACCRIDLPFASARFWVVCICCLLFLLYCYFVMFCLVHLCMQLVERWVGIVCAACFWAILLKSY